VRILHGKGTAALVDQIPLRKGLRQYVLALAVEGCVELEVTCLASGAVKEIVGGAISSPGIIVEFDAT